MGGGSSELIGIAIALIVLLLTFGSFVAAGLPILTAVFGIVLGLTGITAMTAFMDVSSSTTILATMIGLAVGIDYTLFILARYRTELHHTDDREEAVGIAVGTAGSAVVFAGLTVLIALSALSVVGIPFLTAMGLAAAATVLIAVLVALTLLPAILGLLKSKAFGGSFRRYQPKRDEDGRILNNGVRWARFVGKRPVALALLVVVGLGALAIPLKDLHLAFPTDSTASTDTTQRKASDLITDAFGAGRLGPLLAVVDGRDVEDDDARGDAFQDVADWAGQPGRRRQRPGGRHQRGVRRRRQRDHAGHRCARADHPEVRPGRHRHRGPAQGPARRPVRHPGRRPAPTSGSPGRPRSRPTCPSGSATRCRSTWPS